MDTRWVAFRMTPSGKGYMYILFSQYFFTSKAITVFLNEMDACLFTIIISCTVEFLDVTVITGSLLFVLIRLMKGSSRNLSLRLAS